MTKKSGFVPKTFRDAGTEQVFEGGQSHDFDAATYENYKAAGLISDKPSAAKSATAPATSTKRTGTKSKPAKKAAKVGPATTAASSVTATADTANATDA